MFLSKKTLMMDYIHDDVDYGYHDDGYDNDNDGDGNDDDDDDDDEIVNECGYIDVDSDTKTGGDNDKNGDGGGNCDKHIT